MTRARLIDRLLLPAVVSLTTVLFALILLQRLLTQQHAELQAATSAQSVFVKNELESVLKERVLPLELLARSWQVRSNDQDMKNDVPLLTGGYPGFLSVGWVDPAFHVRWAVPADSFAPDADLGADARRRAALEAARDSGSTAFTPPLDLRKGGPGAMVCVPVRADGKLEGFLVGVLRYQDLVESYLQDMSQDYWVAIYDGTEQVYAPSGAVPPGADAPAQEAAIEFGQRSWRARVWPKAGKIVYAQSVLPQLTFVGGLMMAACLAFAVYMGETAQLQNRDLRAEIAAREQAEEALRQAQKMEAVGRLAGGVAHDFNNLLMVIRGHATLLLNSGETDGSAGVHVTGILKMADRASSLTRQLLAFSRKQVLQPRVLNLNVLVSQVADLLPAVLGADIRLLLDLDENLGLTKVDAAQMEQVIMNLVFNARDAMPEGGELTIRTENAEADSAESQSQPLALPLGQRVMLSVEDTGRGMSPEVQSHIFEPFFTTKDRNKGTGLGLATVYGTVSQSGGRVTAVSKEGEGTTIRIELPRVEGLPEAVQKPLAAVPLPPRGNETILVVEDDDSVRRMIREFLKINGYNVAEVKSASEALQFLKGDARTIDLVLTDLIMPGIKGHELGKRVEKLRPGTAILYMSAYTEDVAMDVEMLDPGTAFIEKPFSPDELANKVRKVLAMNGHERKERSGSAASLLG